MEKGVALRDHVAEILRDGPRSISQVGKALRERGWKLHRLAVAGYLKALADAGALEEREIPPAKVYALKAGTTRHDLYASVAERVREEAPPGVEPDRLYLQVLLDLLRRPVFREELRRGGFDVPRDSAEATGDERQAARRYLSKSPLKLPFNDPAYRPKYANAEDEALLRDRAHVVLEALVRDAYHAGPLAMTTRQSTLGGDA